MARKPKLNLAALGGGGAPPPDMGGGGLDLGGGAPAALGSPDAGLGAPPASPMANFAPSDLVAKKPKAPSSKGKSKGGAKKGK